MVDGTGILQEVWRAFETSPLGQALAWGGAGGLVAWWSVKENDRKLALKKQVALGALVAAGTGSLGAAVIKVVLGAELSATATTAIGPVAFATGLFGPAYITMKLREINRSGSDDATCDLQSPSDGGKDADH